jgi:uncharacterized protein involved in outer membrane biogenesis
MSRRTLTIILNIFGGCFILAIGALFIYFNETRLRRLVIPPLESAIGREVEIDGIALTVFTGIGASIDGLRISDRQGFGDGLFLSADHASVAFSVIAALSGQQGLGKMRIDRPNVYIVVNNRGLANYGDLVSSGGNESGSTSTYLPIDQFQLRDGSITYADHRDNTRSICQGVDYDLQLAVEDQEISAVGRLTVDAVVSTVGETVTTHGSAAFAHDIVLDLGRASLSIRRLTLTAGGVSLDATGQIGNLVGDPEVDIDISNVNEWFEMTDGPERISGNLKLDLKVTGSLGANQNPPVYPTLTGQLDVSQLSIATPALLVPLEDGVLSLRFAGSSAVLDTLGFRAAESDLGFSGKLTGMTEWLLGDGRPYFTFSLRSSNLDLDGLLPTEPPASTSSFSFTTPLYASETSLVASPLPELLRTIDGAGSLKIDRVTSGALLTDVSATVRVRIGILKIEKIQGRLYGGSITGGVTLDAHEKEPTLPVSGAFTIAAANADGVLQSLFALPVPLQGKMDLQLSFEARLDSTLAILENQITANGDGKVIEGQIVNWGWLKKAGGGASQLSFMDFDRIPVQDLESKFSVEKGRVQIKELTAVVGDVPSSLSGSIGLDGTLDFKLRMDIPAEKMNIVGINIGKALGSLFGRQPESIPITLNFSGTAEHPTMAVSTR